jgi:hypothetical protein
MLIEIGEGKYLRMEAIVSISKISPAGMPVFYQIMTVDDRAHVVDGVYMSVLEEAVTLNLKPVPSVSPVTPLVQPEQLSSRK